MPTIMMIKSGKENPVRKMIEEPVDPDKKTWYTKDIIRDFTREVL